MHTGRAEGSNCQEFDHLDSICSVAMAHELSNVAAEAFPDTIFLLRKWFRMDDAGDLKKMVCCDNCYRIYPDDARMRYTDRDGNFFA